VKKPLAMGFAQRFHERGGDPQRFRRGGALRGEALAERLIESGDPAHALDAGFAAIAADPLRETPHRIVIRIHLDEGNLREAMRQYDFYRRIVGEQLGLAPSPQMDALVDGVSRHDEEPRV